MSRISSARRTPEADNTLLVLGDLGVALLCALAGSMLLLVLEPGAHAGHGSAAAAQLLGLLGCTAAFALATNTMVATSVNSRTSKSGRR